MATHRGRARGPRPAQRARLAGHLVLRRAELRRLDRPRRDGRRSPQALAARLETRGVTVLPAPRCSTSCSAAAASVGRAHRRRASSTPTSWSARSTRGGCRRWRRTSSARCRRSRPCLPRRARRRRCPTCRAEVVLHGDPMLVLRTGGTAPDGAHAWTRAGSRTLAEDIVTALARKGIDVRDQVEVRVDRSPRELVEQWGGSPLGVLWQGRDTLSRRLGTRTPIAGVYTAGATRRPAPGCRPSGSPPPWSRR